MVNYRAVGRRMSRGGRDDGPGAAQALRLDHTEPPIWIKKRGQAGFSYSSWLLTRVEKKRQADFSEARQGGGDTVMDRDLRRRGGLGLMGAPAVLVGSAPDPTGPRWLRQPWARNEAATTLLPPRGP